MGETASPGWGAVAHRGEVRVEPVPPVDLEVLGQVVRPGETLLANGASGKRSFGR